MATQDKQEALKNEIFENKAITTALSKFFQTNNLPIEKMQEVSTFYIDYENVQKAYSITKQKLITRCADIDPETKQPIKFQGQNGQVQYMMRKRGDEFTAELDKLLALDAMPKPNIKLKYSELPKELMSGMVLGELRNILQIED